MRKRLTRDEKFMAVAIELAKKGLGRTNPNPVVGAVIVKNGKIIGKGYHSKAGLPHAEIMAIRNAERSARNSTLYVTMEPCTHYGRTPPCADSIISAGIRKVVIGMIDPFRLNNGRGIKQLFKSGVAVKLGVLEKEIRALNKYFIKYCRTGNPYVILKAGMSVDGKIATSTGQSRYITSEKSRLYVHRMRCLVDAILVGVNTIISDDPKLNVRHCKCYRQPDIVIMDSDLRIPVGAKVFDREVKRKIFIATANRKKRNKLDFLRQQGGEIVFTKKKSGMLDIRDLVMKLKSRNVTSVLIEGGSSVNSSAVNAGIVDSVAFFISPKIIGGENSFSVIGGKGVRYLKNAIELKNIKIKRLGEDILIEGDIVKCLQG